MIRLILTSFFLIFTSVELIAKMARWGTFILALICLWNLRIDSGRRSYFFFKYIFNGNTPNILSQRSNATVDYFANSVRIVHVFARKFAKT